MWWACAAARNSFSARGESSFSVEDALISPARQDVPSMPRVTSAAKRAANSSTVASCRKGAENFSLL